MHLIYRPECRDDDQRQRDADFRHFGTASGQVPFVPQAKRIFVEFSDANSTVRASTSVAVVTQ